MLIRSTVLLAFVLMAAAHSALAQGVTTGSFTGTIRANDGTSDRVLSGATVKVTHRPTGTVYGAISRKNGTYLIRGVRVGGPYTITVSYLGYLTRTQDGLNVSAGEMAVYDVTLYAEGSAQGRTLNEVLVVAEQDRIFEKTRTGSGSVISSETIKDAPSVNRSISDIARMNPYAQQTSTAGSDGLQGISVGGVNTRFNSFQIDGAVANDMFGLGAAGTAGSQANANFISLDAIEELRVNVSPYDIRQSGFTGGLINAVTRGGTNEIKGSVFAYGRNQTLVGLSPNEARTPYPDFFDTQFGGRIGGPIIADKLFYHVTAESRIRQTPLELGISDPTATNNFDVPPSVMDEIIRIATNQYGYDPGSYSTFTSRNNSFNITARLDWNISDEHRMQFRYNYIYAFQDRNVRRDPFNLSLSSQANEFTSYTNSLVGELNSALGNSMSNMLRIAFNKTDDERVLSTRLFPEVRIYVGPSQSVWLGSERSSQANALDQTQLALTDDLSFFLGEHIITVGTHNEFNSFNNLFIQDYAGSYIYQDVASFADSTPSFYEVRYANTAVTGTEQPRAEWSMIQTGLYVMDEWQALNALRLTFGLRVDAPIFLDEPYYNPAVSENFPGRSTSAVPQLELLWSPRVGFNWDPTGDKTLQIRGGTGLFSGKVAAVWLSNQYSNTGVDLYRARLGVTGVGAPPITDPETGLPITYPLNGEPPVPGDSLFPGSPVATAGIALVDTAFRMPQVWRSTLGVDMRLMQGIVFTVEGMYGKSYNTVDYTNLNLKRSGLWPVSPVDGRPVYQGINPDSMVAAEFTDVILMRSRNEGYQYSVSAQLNVQATNPFLPGLSALLSYTHMAAYDLNSATNAVAFSNWSGTEVVDPNNVSIGRSNYDIPHRLLITTDYRLAWSSDYVTTFGIVFTSTTGRPYSFTYSADINGDGRAFNDLIYVPRDDDYGVKVIVPQPKGTDLRTSEQVWTQIMQLIDSNPILKEYQGRILPRNIMREPWVYQLDMRITQRLPGFSTGWFDVTLDIQNVLNMLSSSWGIQRYVDFQDFGLFGADVTGGKAYDSQGRLRMTYSEPTRNGQAGVYTTDNYYSRWRMQLGLRFTF
jgi:outer membrane receptor for ferrienterochelin and colicin